MTDNSTRSWSRFVPQLNSRWWTALLGLSLMANLLIAGLVLGTRYRGDDRIMGASAVEVFPRSFLRDMPRERRNELMGIVRRDMRGLRDMREGSSEQILKFAEALEKDTGDLALIRPAITAYATGPDSLAARTVTLVTGVIEKMTPEERKSLAAAIRERASRVKERKKN
jgi:Heavy-metal resistance